MRCEHRLTYSFDQCENEATHTLEILAGEEYHAKRMCQAHAKKDAEYVLELNEDGLFAVATSGAEASSCAHESVDTRDGAYCKHCGETLA